MFKTFMLYTGLAISQAAVTLGAKVLERHVTLDRTMKGGDHAASLEPKELQELITNTRVIEQVSSVVTIKPGRL